MGFTPTLIIKYSNLQKYEKLFEEEKDCSDLDIAKVANYLLDVLTYDTIKFDNLELVICYPEFTTFNANVRDKLNDLEIEYQIDN